MSEQYPGGRVSRDRQYVGIDLHRRRSVIVRMDGDGRQLDVVRIVNDPVVLVLAAPAAASPRARAR